MSDALEFRGLRVSYRERGAWAQAVDGVDVRVERGRTHVVVGESGCGKSSLALALLGLVRAGGRVSASSARIDGRELRLDDARDLEQLRGRGVGLVLQESAQALDPRMRVERLLVDGLVRAEVPAAERRARACALLERVGFEAPQDVLARFPHELSGGMRQRVQLASALSTSPRYLVADEPTASLDALLARRVVELLRSLVEREGLGLLVVTHDLAAAAEFGGDMSVMYAGRVVERGPARALLLAPRHPYTEALVRAAPTREPFDTRLEGLPGRAPSPLERPSGCAFAPRCALARPECLRQPPPLASSPAGRELACPPRAEEFAA